MTPLSVAAWLLVFVVVLDRLGPRNPWAWAISAMWPAVFVMAFCFWLVQLWDSLEEIRQWLDRERNKP